MSLASQAASARRSEGRAVRASGREGEATSAFVFLNFKMRRVAASLAGCRLAAQLSVPGVFPLPLDSFRPFSGRRISFPENPAPLPFPPSPSDPVRLFSTKASSVEAAAAEDGDGQALLNSALEAELRESLSGRQLQRLAEAALVRGLREPRLWSLLSQKAMVLNAAGPLPDSAEKGTPPEGEEDKAVKPSAPRPFRFFEALNFLGCFCAAGFRDADLVRSFIPLLLRQMSEMEPRHLLQFLQICEEQRQRQREVYTQLLRVLGSCAQRMYFSETADALCCFAAYRVGSSSCFRSVLRAASEQMRNSTLRECCRVAGALRSLGFSEAVGESEKNTTSSTASCPAKTQSACSLEEAAAAFLVLLNERVSFLTEALPVQLLMDEVQGVRADSPQTAFFRKSFLSSDLWSPCERSCTNWSFPGAPLKSRRRRLCSTYA